MKRWGCWGTGWCIRAACHLGSWWCLFLGYWQETYLGLWPCHSHSLCWCLRLLLPLKAVQLPWVWVATWVMIESRDHDGLVWVSGVASVWGLCFYLFPMLPHTLCLCFPTFICLWPAHDLLQCMKGMVHWNYHPKMSMILGNRRISGRSFSEGPVLRVLEARDLECDQQHNKEHLHVNLSGKNWNTALRYHSSQASRWMKKKWRGRKDRETKCFLSICFCLVLKIVFLFVFFIYFYFYYLFLNFH